jgi:hypothetical protein
MADWEGFTEEVLDGLGPGVEAVWSLLEAAELVVLGLRTDSVAQDLQLVAASADLGEARAELEWVHPQLPSQCPALPWQEHDIAMVGDDTGRDGAAELITIALSVVRGMLRDDGGLMPLEELTALSRAGHLASQAYTRLTGRLVAS